MTNNFTTDQTGIDLIKEFEGFAKDNGDGTASPYQDQNNLWTIGIGSRFLLDGSQVTEDTAPITEEQAEELLHHALRKFELVINTHVIVDLNQNQFDALSDLVYNIGPGNFIQCSALHVLNQGNFQDVPDHIKLWNKTNGQVNDGLVRRRQAECDLFSS